MSQLVFPKEFTLPEMTVSQTAARLGLDNKPTGKTLENLCRTANLMVDIRKLLGDKPVIVSSGYRSPAVNRVIGGSNASAHTLGYAVDFICPGFGTPLQIAERIEASTAFKKVDQLIHEYDSWVHISFDPRARKQTLTINKDGTEKGLH